MTEGLRWRITKAVRASDLPAPARLGLPHIRLPWGRARYRAAESGVVYYLERSDGAIKIGCTSNYPRRRNELVVKHGALFLVAWEFGGFDVEDERHGEFAEYRISPSAEWFRPGVELVNHVLRMRGTT